MDFMPKPEHEMLRAEFRRFAQTEAAPLAAELDEEERFPCETISKLAAAGMLGIPFPREYSAQGADNLAYAMCVEELSRVCATTGVIVSAHTSLCAAPICEKVGALLRPKIQPGRCKM